MSKKFNLRKFLGIFVLVTLLASIIYSIVCLVLAPSEAHSDEHVKSDYLLMLIQCLLGVVVIGLPSLLERKWNFELPNYMTIMYFIFLYCAIYLGEVRNFYYVIPHWDTILHAFSGAMLGAFGFSLVMILNDSKKATMSLSPFFVCLFAFCFALAVGGLWEIYEFSGDFLFGLNMQKFRLADGTLLIGQDALRDTMKDIIIDTIGALVIVTIGYLSLMKKKK